MAKKRSKKASVGGSDGGARRGGSARPARVSGGVAGGGRAGRSAPGAGRSAAGKQLVIVESPSKAKTINKYLGPGYVVLASVGHVRDLPSRNPKGVKSPVPGVDLERNFAPTYEVLAGKTRNIAELKRAAKQADEVWFATDLDREGEAIAWHLAEELGISPARAKRVMFAAITKEEIERAFKNPHPIDMDRVNAQQARRVLDRIVGYQVSPLLWKKVARGLSAGRVQSVAVRLIAEREREIRAFVPDEFWTVTGYFTAEAARAAGLADEWAQWLARRDEKGNPPTAKAGAAWLGERGAFKAELVEVDGVAFDPRLRVDEIIGPMGDLTPDGIAARQRKAAEAFASAESHDLTPLVRRAVELAGLSGVASAVREEGGGRGPARWARRVEGVVVPGTPYRVTGTQVKRTSARAPGPFITSTLQQAAANRMGFSAVRTMRAAQQLYEGVEVPGEGPVGLITYMRTDSTHLSGAALEMARRHIVAVYGGAYLPEKPNFFASSNKAAQEAHEAIRPTNVEYTPARVRGALSPDQHRLYTLIWERFVACQMTPAQWDATAVTIVGGPGERVTFRATGRVLVFDGFYRVLGVPASGEEQTLPKLGDGQGLAPIGIEPRQRFTSAPPRYTEASLIKTLEAEGIGRPSTYASIISVIQDRKYVEQIERRFYATDLGEVVTDKLVEAFPAILDVGYTREMEADLDKVEEEHLDWVDMLHKFYGPFQEQLEHAMENLSHAKAELTPAPEEYRCQKCGGSLVYRFGKNGRFLSCARYPECDYACPVDREGKPRPVRGVDVACPICRGPMFKRTGRFGAFLGCARYGEEQNPCSGILNIDRKGYVVAPTPPPLVTDLACPTCAAPLNLRGGARGPWLGCSRFPKCRGRGKWAELPAEKRAELEAALAAHERSNPVPIIRTLEGRALTDAKGKPLPDAPTVERLSPDGAGDADGQSPGGAEGLLGEVA